MAASQDKEASSSATFGDPFFMPVDESWTMANLKKAIKVRMRAGVVRGQAGFTVMYPAAKKL